MRRVTILVVLVAVGAGCSGQPANTNKSATITKSDREPVAPEIAKALEEVSRKQSQGLRDAKVIVHRVYDYRGYSSVEPIETARLIAVDVEFQAYNRGFDLDDVDIIDGESSDNYGSNPEIIYLTLDGNLVAEADDSSWPKDLGPLRVLLIYGFPKRSTTIKLGYWGQDLTPKPIPFTGDGPVLPKPSK